MTESQPLTTDPLNILIFLGTVRQSTPPKPARLGLRVARACQRSLDKRGVAVELIDPLDIDLDPVFKPHFAYTKNGVPKALDTLTEKIKTADTSVMVSPEYNHAMSPALSNL